MSQWECLFACLPPPHLFLHTHKGTQTHTHTHLEPKLFHHPRRAAHTPKHFGYGPIHILHASMQGIKLWHGYLRLFYMHAKYHSAMTDRGEDTRVCGISVTNYRTYPQPRDYFTHITIATEPAASPTAPVMAHLKLCSPVPTGEGGTRPHHMVFYVAGRGTAGELSCERKDPVDWAN